MVAAELSAESLMRVINEGVVPTYKQRSVKLSFVEPVPLPQLEHLMCIRLSKEQEKRGESLESLYKVLYAPPTCDLCGSQTQVCKTIPNAYICCATTCPANIRPVHRPHMIGVQQIKHIPAWHTRYETVSWFDRESPRNHVASIGKAWLVRSARCPVLSTCLVVLDRNYDAEVLAAVYRSCGAIGDMLTPGWRLKH